MTASTVKVMVKMRSVGVDDRVVMDDEHLWGELIKEKVAGASCNILN